MDLLFQMAKRKNIFWSCEASDFWGRSQTNFLYDLRLHLMINLYPPFLWKCHILLLESHCSFVRLFIPPSPKSFASWMHEPFVHHQGSRNIDTCMQGGRSWRASGDHRISLNASTERAFANFRDKKTPNFTIANFCNINVVFWASADSPVLALKALCYHYESCASVDSPALVLAALH